MSDKPSKLEYIGAFAVLAVVVTLYCVISQFVLNVFWSLVAKLFEKKFN
jgi:hypothetical protein